MVSERNATKKHAESETERCWLVQAAPATSTGAFQSTKVTRTFLEISGWVADFLAVSPGGRIISELICRIIISCHRTKRLVPGDAVKHLLGDCPASQRSQFYRMGAAWANMTVKNKEEWLHH